MYLQHHALLSILDFEDIIRECYIRTRFKKPIAKQLTCVYDFKSYYAPHLTTFHYYSKARAFKFQRDPTDGIIKMWYKTSPLDDEWLGEVVNGVATGIVILKSFPTGTPNVVPPTPIPAADIEQILLAITNSSCLTACFSQVQLNSYCQLLECPLDHLVPQSTDSPFRSDNFIPERTHSELLLPQYAPIQAQIEVDLDEQMSLLHIPVNLINGFHICYVDPISTSGFSVGCIHSSTATHVTVVKLTSNQINHYQYPATVTHVHTLSRDRIISHNFSLTLSNTLPFTQIKEIKAYFQKNGLPTTSSSSTTSASQP